jgi:hypothetical protein
MIEKEILISVLWDNLVGRSHPLSEMDFVDFVRIVEVLKIEVRQLMELDGLGKIIFIDFRVDCSSPKFFDLYCGYSEYSDRVSMRRDGVLDSILDL